MRAIKLINRGRLQALVSRFSPLRRSASHKSALKRLGVQLSRGDLLKMRALRLRDFAVIDRAHRDIHLEGECHQQFVVSIHQGNNPQWYRYASAIWRDKNSAFT